MPDLPAIDVRSISHRYGDRVALSNVGLSVAAGEIFGLLGPNGGGKTTLFRLISTLLLIQDGSVSICGADVATNPATVRTRIGVTFQSPSLDRKLTVRENLVHQGHLHGLHGRDLRSRVDRWLERFGLTDQKNDRVESLSGGMQRRVEVAKGLLHDPQVLLLDEPSTGLDPAARVDLWASLQRLRDEQRVTVLVTTHLMDEAERCDRLGILDRGQLVALGTPGELRGSIGGDCVTIDSPQPDELSGKIAVRFGIQPRRVGGQLRVERSRGHELLRDLVDAFPDLIASVSLGKPTLEDVFIQRTGHRFEDVPNPATSFSNQGRGEHSGGTTR
jgi:ABC-2 type transport system ATP-binding protein